MGWANEFVNYLINKHIKDICEDMTSDQLDVKPFDGYFAVSNINLKPQIFNERLEKLHIPIEVIECFVAKIIIVVTYKRWMFEDISIEIEGLKLISQVKTKCDNEIFMESSIPDLLTASMQFAEEHQNIITQDKSLPLVDVGTHLVNSILAGSKISIKDLTIEIEHCPLNSKNGVALQIKLPSLELENLDQEKLEILSKLKDGSDVKDIVTGFFGQLNGVSFSTIEFVNEEMMSESSISHAPYKSATSLPDDDDVTHKQEKRDSVSCTSERHVVEFARFIGKQELKLYKTNFGEFVKTKQSLELDIGSLVLFLSPRQVHILLELTDAINNSIDRSVETIQQKPMTSFDFELVQEELQRQLRHGMGGLQSKEGWSAPGCDDEELFSRRTPTFTHSSMTDSFVSTTSEASYRTSMSSSTVGHSARTKDPNVLEHTKFKMNLASFIAVVLHEEIFSLSNDKSEVLTNSTVQQMRNTVDTFFTNLEPYLIENCDISNKIQFEKSCKLDHLRLLLSTITFQSNEVVQITNEESVMYTNSTSFNKLQINDLELLECLNYNNSSEPINDITLVNFINKCDSPNLSLLTREIDRGCNKNGQPLTKTVIEITIEEPTIEIDISIAERISALLNPLPICEVVKNDVWSTVPTNPQFSEVDLKLSIKTLNLNLRFPIPDFRPASDSQRKPWWRRNIRNDYLLLELDDVGAYTKFSSNRTHQRFTFKCNSAHISYMESQRANPLLIAKIGSDESDEILSNTPNQKAELQVEIYPKVKPTLEVLQPSEADLMSQSMYAFLTPANEILGPFSAKRIFRQSDTPHDRPIEDLPKLIMPGDKKEMTNFVTTTLDNSRVRVSISLPTVSVQMVSKHIFEVIYNRINNDLLLWKSSALNPQLLINQTLLSDSDDEEEDLESINTSMYRTTTTHLKHPVQTELLKEQKTQSDFCINLNIKESVFSMNVPVRDSNNKVIPSQTGEFLFKAQDIQVFSVTEYQGDENLGFVCIQAGDTEMHHCDMRSSPQESPIMKDVGYSIPSYLHPTIYKTEEGGRVKTSGSDRSAGRDMLSVAIKIQANDEAPRSKTITISLGISNGTINYRMCQQPNTWISQLIDFFNVMDQPIAGYEPKDIVTELHLHIWNSGIDYRPLHIPWCVFVTLGYFTVSSQLSDISNSSTLRFIMEDSFLYLHKRKDSEKPPKHLLPTLNLRKDYICVLNVPLFEISLKTADKVNQDAPQFDLRASNNVVYVTTCADSGQALMEFIKYMADNGDLTFNENFSTSGSEFSSPLHVSVENLLLERPDQATLTENMHKYVNDMLDEAMKESCATVVDTAKATGPGTRVFFFQDERNSLSEMDQILPLVTRDLGDVNVNASQGCDTDDEFCFIGIDDTELANFPKNGDPEIIWLSEEPLHIIEEYFKVPLEKTDFLKTPTTYPMPVSKYALCDMSIIWFMYGGNDFGAADNRIQKKTISFTADRANYTNARGGEVQLTGTTKLKEKKYSNAQKRGGPNRNHRVLIELHLNKIRYQYDVYPDDTTAASRQVLLVNDIEVIDRLTSSNIHKFMYRYSSSERPKQSQAPMLLIRTVFFRPDLKLSTQECNLKVSIAPLRLNIDQDTMEFATQFFKELVGTTTKPGESSSAASSRQSTPTHQLPVMSVNIEHCEDKSENESKDKSGNLSKEEIEAIKMARQKVHENLLIIFEETEKDGKISEVTQTSTNSGDSRAPTFFKKLYVSEIFIKLDYQGKRVDLSHGPLQGIVLGLAQLKSVEFKLKPISYRRGILGVHKLYLFCCHKWLDNILKSQFPNLLSGFSIVSCFVQLCRGLRDLVLLPIQQYRKDGRLMRGLQRGANSFTLFTVMAFLELTLRLLSAIQVTAEQAYIMVSPNPTFRARSRHKGRKRKYMQPLDIREGVASAYAVVREGFGETASNIVEIASHEHEQKGCSGAVGGIIRQIPALVVEPVFIAAEATSNFVGGVQSQLIPDMRDEAKHKWKSEDDR